MTELPRVVTSTDLRALRVCNGVGERKVRDRTWKRAARGVLLTDPDSPANEDFVHIAKAHLGADLVVTGLLVLHELGLPWLPSLDRVHVLVPPELRRRGGELVRVTRTSDFNEGAPLPRSGARLAYPDRAVIDAARALTTLREVRGVVLGAVGRKAATSGGLRAILDGGQRNGSALTRRAINDAERGCASPPEAELVDGLIGKGVPF